MTLDEALPHAFAAGRRAWPQLRVTADELDRWARGAGVQPEALVSRGDDFYLIAGCVAGQPEALAAFERTFLAPIGRRAGSVDLSAGQADELRQALRATLLGPPSAKIGSFRGNGPLRAWVHLSAVRQALRIVSGGAGNTAEPEADARMLELLVSGEADQELNALKERYRDAFQAALEDSFAGLSDREKTLLRMHFLDGLSIEEMAPVFRVHRATVARWLVALRRGVLAQMSRRLSLTMHTSSSEVSSLVRLCRSDIRVSVGRILGPEPGR
jgi:RNA polymerase sigma-70 factor (ECF subfamily)